VLGTILHVHDDFIFGCRMELGACCAGSLYTLNISDDVFEMGWHSVATLLICSGKASLVGSAICSAAFISVKMALRWTCRA